jgi:DNA repair exonuclease SbcCD ATPase subunit
MANSMSNKSDDLPTKSNEDEQRTLHNDNIHNPIISAMLLFEPFRCLLSDLINQNRQLKEEINQLKEQNQRQLRKNQELEAANNEREKQTQLQHQTFVEQLKNIHQQYDLCIKQFNVQSKKNEQFQNGINQLNGKNFKHETDISQLHTDDQNHHTTIRKVRQRLEINVKSLRTISKYLPGEYTMIFYPTKNTETKIVFKM